MTYYYVREYNNKGKLVLVKQFTNEKDFYHYYDAALRYSRNIIRTEVITIGE